MSELLITGSAGMLARALREALAVRGVTFAAPREDLLDITSAESIAEHVTDETTTVLNCAGYTDVDGAEKHEAEATRVNGTAVELLARRCREVGATLVHYSTDYVFDGAATEPYPVDAPREPLGAYGRSKLAGELALEQSGARYFLLRTSWLYAPWGKNFVLTMARLVREKPTLKVVDDQQGRPTSALWLAEATLRLLAKAEPGTYHVTDEGFCSWFELSRAIACQLGNRCEVQPCTTAEFPRPAPRPTYSVLDLAKTRAALGELPQWTTNLTAVLDAAGLTDGTPAADAPVAAADEINPGTGSTSAG